MAIDPKVQHIPENWWTLLRAPLNQAVPYNSLMQGDTLYLTPIRDSAPDPLSLLLGKDSRNDTPTRFLVAENVIGAGLLQTCIDQIRVMFAWQDSKDYMRVEPAADEKPSVRFGWANFRDSPQGSYFFYIDGNTFILPRME